MSIKRRVEQALRPLLGMELVNFGRAGNMGCFEIAERLWHKPSKDIERVGPLLVIHVQCPWRFIGRDMVIVGSRDMYLPAGNSLKVPPVFNWDVPGANRCDERMKQLLGDTDSHFVIEQIEADSTGAVRLSMSEGYRLEIIPDTSAETEHWRLLGPGAPRDHFVVSGGIIED